jgi:Flp pilus assembly pilin Flp
MQKHILKYGVLSGLIAAALMAATVPFYDNLGHGAAGLLVGYTGMVLAFLVVYFGIRSYRDSTGHGHITFARAFSLGLAITLISCAFYVLTWEIIYFKFLPHFMDNYGASAIQHLRDSGATQATIDAQTKALEHMKQLYNNPLYNILYTFIEPFPVGLLITLISAAMLRKRPQPQPTTEALPASS